MKKRQLKIIIKLKIMQSEDPRICIMYKTIQSITFSACFLDEKTLDFLKIIISRETRHSKTIKNAYDYDDELHAKQSKIINSTVT